MALPQVTITGTVQAPDGATGKGDITIVLQTNKGAATVTDDTDTAIKYKLDKRPIKAKILADGTVKQEDELTDLQLVPNALIDPLNTYYLVTYRINTNEKQVKWQEQWYLDNTNVQIGEIVPIGVNANLSVSQETVLNSLNITNGGLYVTDNTRGGKQLSVDTRREHFTIKNLSQPAQFALYHELVSSDSGVYVAKSETVVGIEVSSGGNHTADYSLRYISDLGTDLFTAFNVNNVRLAKDYTLNFDLTPDQMFTVYYNPTLGQEGSNINIAILLKERL